MVSQPAIQRHDEHQHQRHGRHRVRARLGRKLGEHEGFAQRLHDLVRREQQEPVQKEQERGAALAGRHARDERQQPLEAGQAGMVGIQAVSASATDESMSAATVRPRLLSVMHPPCQLLYRDIGRLAPSPSAQGRPALPNRLLLAPRLDVCRTRGVFAQVSTYRSAGFRAIPEPAGTSRVRLSLH